VTREIVWAKRRTVCALANVIIADVEKQGEFHLFHRHVPLVEYVLLGKIRNGFVGQGLDYIVLQSQEEVVDETFPYGVPAANPVVF